MAQTTAADVDAQIPEVWSDDLFAQAENQTYWSRYEGEEGSSMPIIRRDQLEGQESGDTVRVDLVLALTGAGQTSELASVEGNEEALKFRQSVLTVTELSHGVRWTKKGKILINHRMRETAKNQLAKWLAGKLDDRLFNELSGNGATTMPTASKWAAGTATSRATVADTNAGGRLTLDTLTELKAYAQTDLKIEPIRIDEDDNEYFLFTAHPYAIMQLKRDDTKWAQAQREAQVRGNDNPLFTGDAAIWDGVIIKPSNRVPRSTNGTIQVADNIFSGAKAASRAYAYYPDWTEEYFDYGRKQGIATYCLVGEGLNVFDLTAAGGAAAADKSAIGAVVVYTAAVAPSAP
jgi:N4-gp56 family major capsid protein